MDRALAIESFRFQARASADTGSPIYAELLGRAAEDLEAGGVFAELVEGFEGHPILRALPLRVMGAIHRIVLDGRAAELAAHYPSAGGRFEPERAWRALLEVARLHGDEIRGSLGANVQTNEVLRSAALLGGFLRIARETGAPLRLREIGSSAGLNLVWDRYRYELGPHRWGDPRARLLLRSEWSGAAPDLSTPVRVESRAGCDVAPIDLSDPAARRRLESFVWPEQTDRLALLRAALETVSEDPPRVDAMAAGAWLARELAEPARGEATVVFHSVVWWYIPKDEQERITREMEAAGERASARAPLAWLRMEGSDPTPLGAELRLRSWPGGEDRRLARVHWHGRAIEWLAS